jgi:hypothetical protein
MLSFFYINSTRFLIKKNTKNKANTAAKLRSQHHSGAASTPEPGS